MSISDWQEQAARLSPVAVSLVAGAPLVAVLPPPARESSDVELGQRLAGDLAALTRVLLGPDLPPSAVVVQHQPLPAVVETFAVADVVTGVALEDVVVADLVAPEHDVVPTVPVVLEAPLPFVVEDAAEDAAAGSAAGATFVAPPVVEIEPLFVEPAVEESAVFVAPPVIEVEPLVPLEPPPPRPSRLIIDEISSLDL